MRFETVKLEFRLLTRLPVRAASVNGSARHVAGTAFSSTSVRAEPVEALYFFGE
jgi:hypothetical protein